MLCFRRVAVSNILKLSQLIKCHSSSNFMRFKQIHTRMASDYLQPPLHVKGMTILDKERFKKTVTVPCLYLPYKSIKDSQKLIKSYLLKLQSFRPIVTPSQTFIEALQNNGIHASIEEGKMAMLDPRKITNYGTFPDKDRIALENVGISECNMASDNLILNYENWKADEILRAVIPDDVDAVSGYSMVGHIVHLNLREHLVNYKKLIGHVLLDKIKCARSVVNKLDVIDNTFRNFQMEMLCGDEDMVTKVRENKCIFEFDFSQVYWNPRLCTEHERITEVLSSGDIVYDVFCGVGPFAIPAAKKGAFVLANDLNPHSIKWLCRNINLNKVENNVKTCNKDGLDFIREDLKNHVFNLNPEGVHSIRIIMNLPALATTFISAFQNLFTLDEMGKINQLPTPKVIIYCFIKGICDPYETALQMIKNELDIDLQRHDKEIEDIFDVRDVAPNKKMMRITLLLTNKILSSRKRSVEEKIDNDPKRLCH